LTGRNSAPPREAKLHLLLDHDGHLPCYAAITEGKVADVTIAQQLKLPKGSLIVMDRGYNDYHLFERWSAEDVGFVTRMKKNADWYIREELPLKEGSVVRRDTLVEFNCFQAGRQIKGTYRRVVVWLEDKQQELVLLTNRLDLAAGTIAEIYKQRWQIELFFKAIKQNLRIKTFVGTSANAVRIQIWTALISMLLLKLLQFRSRIDWALSNLVALLRWNLFTHKDLWKWIDNPFFKLANAPPGAVTQAELDGIVRS
jgi:IS4 transposase